MARPRNGEAFEELGLSQEDYLAGLTVLTHDLHMERFAQSSRLTEDSSDVSPCCFRIELSPQDGVVASQMEAFWSSLQGIAHPVSFEMIGSGDDQKVVFQLLCHADERPLIANQLTSLFPDSSLNPQGDDIDYLLAQLTEDGLADFDDHFLGHGFSLGLARHYAYPLRTFNSFERADPLSAVITPLAELEPGQTAVIQMLISPLRDWNNDPHHWVDHLERIEELSRMDRDNVTGFHGCPVAQKRRSPLFASCLRAIAFGGMDASFNRVMAIPQAIEEALASFRSPDGNHLTSTPDELLLEGYDGIPEVYREVEAELEDDEILSVFERKTYRRGFLLNSQELASLCHFPSRALQHPKLLGMQTRVARAPRRVTAGQGLLLGVNEMFGRGQEVYLLPDARFRHVYCVGKTGTGKTTLLLNMLRADIDAGEGVALIDPHGDLVEMLLRLIPEHRIDDVILFDPSDHEYPIGFNMFEASTPLERRQLRSDILTSVRRLFDSSAWGDNIDQLFRVSIATLLADSTCTHTLMDMRRLISDEVFRSQVLRRIDDDFLLEFWRDDYPDFTRATTSAVRRRLSSVLNEPEVRHVLSQNRTSFSFREMMDTRKIFLAKISRGTLGEDISSLFGGLLTSKIQLTAMARESQPEAERVPFYLYVDEFQSFVNEGFEVILSEARKYRLGLTISHQFTGQLPSRLYNAVFGNVGTLVVFETGVDDASALEKQLGAFTKDDIINLERFHTLVRIGKARETFSMRTLPPPEVTEELSEAIRAASRAKYCQPTAQASVEQEANVISEADEISIEPGHEEEAPLEFIE